MIVLRIARLGYGSVIEVEEFSATRVLGILSYEGFLSDYEQLFMEMNKQS